MTGHILFTIGLVIALVIGCTYFRDLGDVSQMLIKVKRENMLRFIRNEYRLLAIGGAAIALMVVAYFDLDGGVNWLFWPMVVLLAFLYIFPWVWVHVGLRNQRSTAKYYSLEEARAALAPAASVVVFENNGVARAHPDSQLMRPHLAGNEDGLAGENVIMTYCAMANLDSILIDL